MNKTAELIALGQKMERKYAAFHRHNKNGYVDLTTGGWGVLLFSRKEPQPGDRVYIPIVKDGIIDYVEEEVDKVLNEYPDYHKSLKRYLVSIKSQDQINKLLESGPIQYPE